MNSSPLKKIQEVVAFARQDKSKFTELVRKTTKTDGEKAIRSKTTDLSKADRRIAELDLIIKRIYEDNFVGKLYEDICCKGRKSNPSNTEKAAGSSVAV